MYIPFDYLEGDSSMRVEITKDRLGAFIYNAISLLQEDGWVLERVEQEIGITHDEYISISENSFTIELTDDERGAIAREVDREDKLRDIVARVNDLDEDESPLLNGYSATEIIEDARLLDAILIRHERAEGWVDNGSYWATIDDCIKDVMKKRTQYI